MAALMLSACSLHVDNVSREGQALAAFRLATHTGIYIRGALMARPRRFTQFFFPNGIADADYHRFE